ncbi:MULTISPECIES: glycoside hydrolase family 99-like domain-containing protein [Geobacter]|uniref:glycoside hydrolase family 99-like domain-containing protein n=1 Tax=Geobacter TaxID=28231 RepID=UPI0020B6850C|nr:glycoside hydrolase family 99-like domain-containing protein [Geobacter sulfurreducens]UTG91310.1 glycoside hydrolase family 99-like domain-containing protein [Geobacter sulfurreducens]BEH10157.1 hypothetical protein GSUET_17690 [Geobacter sulfurreducens subsp. ethanolicus]BET58257.1 hypothetical protein GEO60473_12970 [Geobacter sp. 60473]
MGWIPSLRLLLSLIIGVFLCVGFARANSYNVGVYYFPAWYSSSEYWNDLRGLEGSRSPGRSWPEREPLLGFNYPEEDFKIAEKHLQWMYEYGIDFIIYDWYWKKDNTTKLEHAINAYLKAKNNNKVKFTILWANETDVPVNLQQFTLMVSYWINNYFNKKQYVTIDGKPVVFIFSPERLRDSASSFGMTSKDLLDIARKMSREAGYGGIYFVGCAQAIEYFIKDFLPNNGYDAISAYNYHRGYSGVYEKGGLAVNYSQLSAGYKQSWEWILSNTSLPYFLPVTAGWSKKPWGSFTPHDECISDPNSFKEHLLASKEYIDSYNIKTKSTVVICCWNEFAEGSYIEPTKRWQFQYLQAVKDVFGR